MQDLPATAVLLHPFKPGQSHYRWCVPREDVDAFATAVLNGDSPMRHPFDPSLEAVDVKGQMMYMDLDASEWIITVRFALPEVVPVDRTVEYLACGGRPL